MRISLWLALWVFLGGFSSVVAQDVETVASAPVFTLNGSISASMAAYNASGIPDRQTPFTWLLSGSLTPTIKSVAIPLSFVVSERERSFRQAFNIVGISPKYQWATVHAGYRSLQFSRYTLAGVQFLGGGFELAPANFKVAAMYGRLQRAVEPDSTQQYVQPAYQRMGYAAQAGYAQGPWKVMLNFLQAKDDSASLKNLRGESAIKPQQNSVVAMELGAPIVPGILTFTAEGAMSVVTTDLRSPDILPENSDVPALLRGLQPLKTSTRSTAGMRAGLNANFSKWGVRLNYERLDPGFASFGAYYFTTDVENYTIAPRLRLGTVNISGSIGLQRDNLENQKPTTTNRLIGSGNLDWVASQAFGINLSYTNYSTNQAAGQRALNDTIAIRNVTRSATVSPRLTFQEDTTRTHSITAMASYQDYTDLNAFTRQFSENSSITGTLGYTVSFVPSALTCGVALSGAQSDFSGGSNQTLGVSLNGGIALMKNTLSLNSTITFSQTNTTGLSESKATVFNENLSVSYRLTDADNLSLSGYATQVQASGQQPAFTETQATLSYSRSFNW
ncbi:MAG: hypothetical protein IT211_15790 [Armatimonadetes bacterium]|nr:hypothetical protein [Armatimonadota bacterium]